MLGRLDVPPADGVISPADVEAATILSSPLVRALRTAQLLFPQRDIEVLEELAEIGMGEWEGRTWAEIERMWPALAREKIDDWTGVIPPDGEPWPAFERRVQTAWQTILSAPAPVAVVAHTGVNSVLAQLATGRSPLAFRQDYCEVITLEV